MPVIIDDEERQVSLAGEVFWIAGLLVRFILTD
jgi:hypothetical protein